jgi:hypothetical protein
MKFCSPSRQGDFDGACGFYSIGNSLSLLFKNVDIDDIFFTMFAYYIKEHGDADTFINGMYRGKLNEILKNTIKKLNLHCSIYRPCWSKPAPSLKVFRQTLKDCLVGNGSIAIMGYEYSKIGESDFYSHWTVIKKITEKSIITHDSSEELKRIPFSKCRIWDNNCRHKSRPYKLSSTDLFVLSINNT